MTEHKWDQAYHDRQKTKKKSNNNKDSQYLIQLPYSGKSIIWPTKTKPQLQASSLSTTGVDYKLISIDTGVFDRLFGTITSGTLYYPYQVNYSTSPTEGIAQK